MGQYKTFPVQKKMEDASTSAESRPRKSRRVLPIGCAVTLLLAIVLWWWFAPWFTVWSMCLADKKGEESSRAVCDRIVAHGERAVPAIISSIKSHSPWVRRYCYLPIALREIGGSAHPQLLRAIDRESDPAKRAYLVSSLHTAFKDYSRFGVVLNDMRSGDLGPFAVYHFAIHAHNAFPDAPPLMTEERTLNREFLDWWSTNRFKAPNQ